MNKNRKESEVGLGSLIHTMDCCIVTNTYRPILSVSVNLSSFVFNYRYNTNTINVIPYKTKI